jgi:hypothetical protein
MHSTGDLVAGVRTVTIEAECLAPTLRALVKPGLSVFS